MVRKKKDSVSKNPSVTPSVNPTPEIKTVTPDEIKGLGIREVERIVTNKPYTVSTQEGRNLMDFKTTVEKHIVTQAYLNKAEVEKMGIRGWWPFRDTDWTTIIHGRRFLLKEEIFQDMKDRGLVLPVTVAESIRWKNK